jgi:2-C-methyl-D-erythritol 4-phosphate cytidylyltransferase/2-C-methyl-D-erythritol 2,4-cyclodiphosphate synthase
MGGVDKLLEPLGGQPLLARTLAGFAAVPMIGRIIVVTSGSNDGAIAEAPWLPAGVTQVVRGGARRQESVAAGVESLDPPADRAILVHDGARPLVSRELIESVVRATVAHGAAIPVLPIAETVKRLDGEIVGGTVDRAALATAQTPQGVRAGLLREAYDRFPPGGPETWTDEAALLEACRIPVHVVPGDPANLKVTVPADLHRAEATMAGPIRSTRTGIGHDAHPFGPGAPLRLGGIEIPGAARLHGHSDGDVALHAIADALLGAAGLGDLGRLAPAGPQTPAGIDSRELLTTVVERLAAAGWRPASVDLTITAARPRLGDHLDAMRATIAALLDLDHDAVSVKASTGNLDGADGAGRSISTLALATIEARS